MTKVKICGITNEEDATWAVNLGANYVGLNFHKDSPRNVSPDLAARIAKKVPSFVPTVGVFVEQTAAEIVKIAKKVGLAGVQLHGDHTVADCESIASELEGVFSSRRFEWGPRRTWTRWRLIKMPWAISCWTPGWTANWAARAKPFRGTWRRGRKRLKNRFSWPGDSPLKTWPRPLKRRNRSPWTWPAALKNLRNEKISTK
ncbi:MAG: hypothetical protein IPN19_04530 [Elusimicrobia bacterium]|nr:hypothetical protein [Elusimicrobiota bacterium]